MSEQRVLGEVIVGIGTEFVRLGGFERVCTFIGQLVGGRGRGFAQVAVEHHASAETRNMRSLTPAK